MAKKNILDALTLGAFNRALKKNPNLVQELSKNLKKSYGRASIGAGVLGGLAGGSATSKLSEKDDPLFKRLAYTLAGVGVGASSGYRAAQGIGRRFAGSKDFEKNLKATLKNKLAHNSKKNIRLALAAKGLEAGAISNISKKELNQIVDNASKLVSKELPGAVAFTQKGLGTLGSMVIGVSGAGIGATTPAAASKVIKTVKKYLNGKKSSNNSGATISSVSRTGDRKSGKV